MIRFRMIWLSVFVVGLLMALGGVPAMAHKVSVFAWVEADTVYAQSKFYGGKPVVGASVGVYNSSGKKLMTGVTSDTGMFSFAAPAKGDLTIVVDAGSGHRGEWTVKAGEFGQAAAPADTPTIPATAAVAAKVDSLPAQSDSWSATTLDHAQLQQIVEAAVEKKIGPLRQMLADNRQDQPSAKDIVGGIGYIFGLVGIVAYVRSRRGKKEAPA